MSINNKDWEIIETININEKINKLNNDIEILKNNYNKLKEKYNILELKYNLIKKIRNDNYKYNKLIFDFKFLKTHNTSLINDIYFPNKTNY